MNKEQTLAVLTGPLPPDEDEAGNSLARHGFIEDKGVSEWVLAERAEYIKTVGYPYIESVKDWIVEKHKLKLTKQQAGALGTMVFFATDEGRKRQEAAAGWTVPTTEWLLQRVGKKIEILGENMLGGDVVTLVKVKRFGERFFGLKARARNRGYDLARRKARDPRPAELYKGDEGIKLEVRTVEA